MAALRVSQRELAAQLGITRSSLSAYLNGYQAPPSDFETRATVALDTLEEAEHAAAAARQHVLKRKHATSVAHPRPRGQRNTGSEGFRKPLGAA